MNSNHRARLAFGNLLLNVSLEKKKDNQTNGIKVILKYQSASRNENRFKHNCQGKKKQPVNMLCALVNNLIFKMDTV